MALEASGRPLIAIRLPPAEAASAILGFWASGRAVLPLDPRSPTADVERVLRALRPTHLLDGAGGPRDLDAGRSVSDEIAAVVATSGTTGEARGAELTWNGMRASVKATMESVGAGAGDRWLCCVPVHHVAGLAILARAWVGGIEALIAPFEPANLGATGADYVSLVPTMLSRALDARADWSPFRRVLVGASVLTEQLRGRAAEAGVNVVDGYGLTETWGGVVHDGRPLSGVEARLGPDDEIWFRGAMVMAGYRLQPEATARVLTPEGWFRTGDAGHIDVDGRLRVTSRLRELIVTGGVNVSPAEVEEVLARCPGVSDVCVGGRPDAEWGERIVAYVVPTDPGDPPSLATVRAFACDRLAAAKVPREVVVVDAIPRTETGKPLRRLLGT